MNTLPALPPVVYLAGRYMTSLDMFMAKVRDVLSSTRRNALMEQEHLLALYRDGVLLDWLRTLSPTDHRAASMHRSMEKMMQQTMTDTEAKKALGNLFGAKEARVTALRFDEYLELLPECMVRINRKSFKQSIDDGIDMEDIEDKPVVITLSFRVIKAANDVIPIAFGKVVENIPLQIKGKVHSVAFHVILSNGDDLTVDVTSHGVRIHSFKFSGGWVDLGFGVKWATCNIGAKNPWDSGVLYNNKGQGQDKNEDLFFAIRPFRHWEIPTQEDFENLFNECDRELIRIKGINCCKLTSKKNGRSIVIPCAGVWNDKSLCYSYVRKDEDSIDRATLLCYDPEDNDWWFYKSHSLYVPVRPCIR